jgi:cephalosporin hydroxylase
MTEDRNEVPTSHGDPVDDAATFERDRAGWRRDVGDDARLRERAIALQVAADAHHYTYTWSWLGVPVIRLPDDVAVLQELFWSYRPQRVVETGVARGGSMLLDASLQRLCGLEPHVLGIDIAVFEHTRAALEGHPMAEGVELLEADSTSTEAHEHVRAFLGGVDRAVLVLDSNHTHEHVLAELRSLAPLLPQGAFVLVADTLIEEFPAGHFENRPWDRGDNPLTALRAFLEEAPDFEPAPEWGRRGLLSEFRDGILRRRA